MILKLYEFDNDLTFSEDTVAILSIEIKRLFINIARSFYMYANGLEGTENFKIYQSDTEVNISKDILVSSDFLNSSLQERKITTKLYKVIEESFSIFPEQKNQIINNLIKVNTAISDVMLEYDFNIVMNEEVLFADYFKAIGLKFENNLNNYPYENVLEMINVVSELNIYKAIVFIDSFSMMSNKEINAVIKHIQYKKIPVLFLERKINKQEIKGADVLVISEDYDDFFIKL